jgi:hypothetical protein
MLFNHFFRFTSVIMHAKPAKYGSQCGSIKVRQI